MTEVERLKKKLSRCMAALHPEDRLNSGGLIYRGKKADHIAEQMHMLGIMLHAALKTGRDADVKRIKREIERLYRLCAVAMQGLK